MLYLKNILPELHAKANYYKLYFTFNYGKASYLWALFRIIPTLASLMPFVPKLSRFVSFLVSISGYQLLLSFQSIFQNL